METSDAAPLDSIRTVPCDAAALQPASLPTEQTGRPDGNSDMEGFVESETGTEASTEDLLLPALDALTKQISRFHERSARSEEIIRTMQSRITELQGDQIQALLKPTIQRFAGLHAQAADALQAAIDRNEYSAADFSFFMTSIEDALGLIDFDSVGAAVGVAFDSTRHHATSVTATGDLALDRTIQRVIRQGFKHADAARVSIPALVTIYQYDESLSTTEPTAGRSANAIPDPTTDPSIAL